MRPRWYSSPDARWRLGVLVLVLLAIPLRMHGLDRSLWLDEAWVANSVLEPDLAGVFYYEPWLQTTPPVFLLLERWIVAVLPPANVAFRLLPFLLGVLGVALVAHLALRLVRPALAFLVVLLLVLSHDHILYSQTLKQFTGDVLVTAALLLAGLAYLQHRTSARLALALVLFVALAGLSYNAVLFTPALLYGALLRPPDAERRWPQLALQPLHALAVLVTTAVAALTNYLVFIRPNLGTNILGGENLAARTWYDAMALEKVLNLVKMFRHLSFDLSGALADLIAIVAAAVALLGFLYLVVRARRGRPANIDRAALLALPILGAFGLNLIGYYPLSSQRLSLFLLPNILLLAAFGVQAVHAGVRLFAYRRRLPPRAWRRVRPEGVLALGFGALLVLRLVLEGPAPYLTWQLASDEDTEAAVAHLAGAAGPDDTVYVDTSMLEPFKLYARQVDLAPETVVHGRLSWPCCPRNAATDPADDPEGDVRDEVDRLLGESAAGRLWMLYTSRRYRWEVAGRCYPDLYREALRTNGCTLAERRTLTGVLLDAYTCGGAAEPANEPATASACPATVR